MLFSFIMVIGLYIAMIFWWPGVELIDWSSKEKIWRGCSLSIIHRFYRMWRHDDDPHHPDKQSRTQSPQALWPAVSRQERLWGHRILSPLLLPQDFCGKTVETVTEQPIKKIVFFRCPRCLPGVAPLPKTLKTLGTRLPDKQSDCEKPKLTPPTCSWAGGKGQLRLFAIGLLVRMMPFPLLL